MAITHNCGFGKCSCESSFQILRAIRTDRLGSVLSRGKRDKSADETTNERTTKITSEWCSAWWSIQGSATGSFLPSAGGILHQAQGVAVFCGDGADQQACKRFANVLSSSLGISVSHFNAEEVLVQSFLFLRRSWFHASAFQFAMDRCRPCRPGSADLCPSEGVSKYHLKTFASSEHSCRPACFPIAACTFWSFLTTRSPPPVSG